MVSCVSETRSRSLTSLPEETTQTSVQERPEGVQRCQAEGQCSIQPQHRESNQHVSRSRQYSQRGSDPAVRCGRTPGIDQNVDTNRSRRGAGVHVYNPHLLDNRGTSSSVCKAGALAPSPSCLGGGPHGWVPVDTHSTPVLTSTQEAVGGRCSIRVQYIHKNTCNSHMVAEHEFRTTTQEATS